MENEIQRRNDRDPEVMKRVEPACFTFDAKRTLKKQKDSAQKKPHTRRHGGKSGQEEVFTHPTEDGGRTDGRGNVADELFDGHGDTADGNQTNDCRYLVFG